MITIRIFMRIADPTLILLGTAIVCSLASAAMLAASFIYWVKLTYLSKGVE